MIPSSDRSQDPGHWAWHAATRSGTMSTQRCLCGRSIFFPNTVCLGCKTPLGYEPSLGEIRPLLPTGIEGRWQLARHDGEADDKRQWRRCANLDSAASCNWLIAAEESQNLCVCCRLNRTIPDLGDAANRRWWHGIERAKRRLVAQLLDLGLPVRSKLTEDPARGLMFDLLRPLDDERRVLTGHDNGLVTLNVEEADDAIRERTRQEMGEPYRTLLGHCRHEVGHYYWDLLVSGSPWHEKFRQLFGDERADYSQALERNYRDGPSPDWPAGFISSYASVHPWEDWAETWAHYLHMVDTLDTARKFGLPVDEWGREMHGFGPDDLYAEATGDSAGFLPLVNAWIQLTTVLNELSRSMGQHDLYPFVINRHVVTKLHFIHLVVHDRAEADTPEPELAAGQA